MYSIENTESMSATSVRSRHFTNFGNRDEIEEKQRKKKNIIYNLHYHTNRDDDVSICNQKKATTLLFGFRIARLFRDKTEPRRRDTFGLLNGMFCTCDM